MYGFSSGSTCVVNAEFDSMGGVVDNGGGFGSKPSPRRVAIEKAQVELRLEYDVLEERRRELEFLEKGGNPLDFKFGNAASVSVQSTSRTDHHPDQFFTRNLKNSSEAKGSFALATLPHGDSVESSERLGVSTACERNSANNFDGKNELLKGQRKSIRRGRGSITSSKHSSQLGGSQSVKESEGSPIFHLNKGHAYRRRNRSRPSCDGPRSSSIDGASRVGHRSCVPNRHTMLSKSIIPENHSEVESDGTQSTHGLHLSTSSRASEFLEGNQDTSTSKGKQEEKRYQSIKAEESPIDTRSLEPDLVAEEENIVPVDDGCSPCSDVGQNKNDAITDDLKECGKINGDGKCTPTEGLLSNTRQATKRLNSESSGTQTSCSVNGNIDNERCLNLRSVDGNGIPEEEKLWLGENSARQDERILNEKLVNSSMECSSCNEDQNTVAHQGNGFAEKDKEKLDRGKSPTGNEAKCPSEVKCQEAINQTETKSEGQASPLGDSIPKPGSSCLVRLASSVDPTCYATNRTSPPVSQPQTCAKDQKKVVDKANEESILEEARIVQAKRHRVAELSGALFKKEYGQKCHWDFVVEEMAWLANDFAQERIWKMAAVAQICRQIGFASRLRLEKQNKCSKQKILAHNLARSVMEFWHSAGLLMGDVDSSQSEKCLGDATMNEVSIVRGTIKELQSREQKRDLAVNRYAVRFLQFNQSSMAPVKVELPGSPLIASDLYIPEISCQEQFTENLNYVVPPGAMDTYRRSIESCLAKSQRMDYNMREEVDTCMYDIPAEFGYQENNFEEDEGENVYYLPEAFGTGKPSKKKLKNMKSYATRSYDSGSDYSNVKCRENRNGPPQSALVRKRPSTSLHVDSIPTKRMRTASRQRIVGFLNTSYRRDASSGDTNSFQDDQSTVHGGSIVPRSSKANSSVDFEKQSNFDCTESFAKPKKKKKIKHQGAAYDQRWPHDSPVKNKQKEHLRNRLDGYQLESNVNGLFGHNAKKMKLMKKSLDSLFDNTIPMGGSLASPVASQMSNMSNQGKIIKLIGVRNRCRKAKALKVPAGQSGTESPWTLFEDQALVVLVHDMGPNWELVSDAMNITLQFKCIFRNPQECKERHKILMDRTSGDGADFADDSGSSQPYPSTLPGIPKGSARQLFQHLQGPVEEDTIKSHFEKMILIRQQLHYQKKQDLKQIMPVHGSHVVTLSQVIPNSMDGVTLTPLDLCEVPPSNDDLLPLGFQGLPLPNQGTVPPVHSSGVNSPQTSFNMGVGTVGSNLASPSQLHSSRDARYPVPRSASLPIEEKRSMQKYNQMLHGRNIQPSNLTFGASSGSDRSVSVPSGKGDGMVFEVNRSMPMRRPELQRLASSSMLNSGIASGLVGLPSNMNMPSGAASGQANSIFRPHDPLHMVRPGQNSEHERQMVVPETQNQGPQSSNQGDSSCGRISSGFTNQTVSPPLQTYPSHHHQQHSHVLSGGHNHLQLPGLGSSHSGFPEQQALLRLTRERQMQQKMLHRQKQRQQLLSSGPLSTHVQTLPEPSSSLLQSQAAPLPPLSPSSQSGHSGMVTGKQRQRQAQLPYQQTGRQHPQQRQQGQVLYSVSGGLSMMHPSKPLASPPNSGHSQSLEPYVNNTPAMPKQVQQIPASNQGASLRVVPPINRQHLQGDSQPPIKSMNQLHPTHKRAIQRNHLVNFDTLNKLQTDQSLSEQQFASNYTSSAIAMSSSNNTSASKASESPCDSGVLSSPSSSGPVSSPGVTNSSGNYEQLSSISEGLAQRQLSSNLAPQGNRSESQWDQEQS